MFHSSAIQATTSGLILCNIALRTLKLGGKAFMNGFNSTADSFFVKPSDDARADVTAAVEELLNSLSNKFAGVSSEIFAKSEYLRAPVPHHPANMV